MVLPLILLFILIGMIPLDIILPMTCGQPKIEVTFEIDASGLLTEVAAIEKSSGSNQNTIAANDNGSLSQDEIDIQVLSTFVENNLSKNGLVQRKMRNILIDMYAEIIV
jgi:molecular chaperone DnaK (HSP70)